MRIGIVALSSKVPPIEFQLGLDQMTAAGFDVVVHPSVMKHSEFFSGNDETRARSFFEYAKDPSIDAIWCARGGYGVARVLPLLDQMSGGRALPAKTLVGYSDATALAGYVRDRWKWKFLHAPMPGLISFCKLKPSEWRPLVKFARGEEIDGAFRAKWVKGFEAEHDIRGELMGGNLTVWASLAGTPYLPKADGKIIFFEDVAEPLYRIDRAIQQLIQSRALEGARAIVLGNFLDCADKVSSALRKIPKGGKLEGPLAPIRANLNEKKKIPAMFSELAGAIGAPLAQGLPIGHGPGHSPIMMGVSWHLKTDGTLVRG